MAFPSTEFGAQEYETDEEIKAFADQKNFPGVLMKLGNLLGLLPAETSSPRQNLSIRSETCAGSRSKFAELT